MIERAIEINAENDRLRSHSSIFLKFTISNFKQKVAGMIERAVEINAENDRLRGREKEVEEENVKHLKKKEQLEKERLDEFFLCLALLVIVAASNT